MLLADRMGMVAGMVVIGGLLGAVGDDRRQRLPWHRLPVAGVVDRLIVDGRRPVNRLTIRDGFGEPRLVGAAVEDRRHREMVCTLPLVGERLLTDRTEIAHWL